MPEYRCRGKNCNFHTDDIGHLMLHVVEEHTPKLALEPKPAPEPKKEPTEEPKRHKTVDDYLDCPECMPRFKAGFEKRGYTVEKKPEKKRGLRILERRKEG